MRTMSFLMGGIVGAAAVIYFMNNNRQSIFSFNAAEKASKWMNGATDTKSPSKSEANWSGGGLNTVEQMINEDPEVKKAVQEIMKKETTYQTQ
ncbi:hypothetical protein [Ferviditalea candida]|uniref:Uncharacterized protein n=1 Tax=Ferviditalea candida TaxID=3108399 RepID=A0ABU5ZNT5_9BACL|nr:hypothetical protein [Paenibacillaceae bacterium T2]